MKPNESQFPLGDALGFLQRLWRLNHALQRRSAHMEKTLGITAQQRFVIRCVGSYPGITAGQLAEVMHVDPGTISAMLRRLEAREIVERRRDPSDSRRVTLGLTHKGRSLDAPMLGSVEGAVEQLLAKGEPREIAAAVSLLDQFSRLLDETMDARPKALVAADATETRARK